MRLALLLTASLLASCIGIDPEVVDGPYYTQGFTDGCRTANARQAKFDTSVFRDAFLFKTDDSYSAGWRAGYSDCQPQGLTGVEPATEGLLTEPF
ncbi:MAG: hypothetical protein AAGI89_13480 [Pseudomonadota bacterium]